MTTFGEKTSPGLQVFKGITRNRDPMRCAVGAPAIKIEDGGCLFYARSVRVGGGAAAKTAQEIAAKLTRLTDTIGHLYNSTTSHVRLSPSLND